MPTLISRPRFTLRPLAEPLPDDYRIATRHDVATFKAFLWEAMPAWEIACLTDGWVDGCCYGGNTGSETREKLGHKLGVLSQATHFVLHPRTQALPANYRLATRHDVAMYKQFMWEVVPSGEVAYLKDGWVDSGYLQCLTGPDKREVLANQVGILMPSRVLCLQPLSTPFNPHYRLATRQDVKQNMQSLCEVMPAWEVAHLGDGWVEGTAYRSKTGADWRQGLTHKLGFLDTTIPVIQEPGIDIVLDPTGDLECCLATALTKAQLRELSSFAPVADEEQRQKLRELCAMWDMDLMLHGMAHMKLFEHEDHCISLRCNGITGECRKQVLDEQGATCVDDYYQIDVESNGQMYASVFVPAGKSVGAGAIRKAFMESLQNAAAAMFVPAPFRLVESYRWVLLVEPASAERAVFFYAVV